MIDKLRDAGTMVINNPRPFGVCVFTRLDDHFGLTRKS